MITYKDIEKRYCSKIPLKFKRLLGDKINDKYCQDMIKKSLNNQLIKDDYDNLFKKGNQSSKEYPGLNYICTIFIHPLTIIGSLINLADKFEGMTK